MPKKRFRYLFLSGLFWCLLCFPGPVTAQEFPAAAAEEYLGKTKMGGMVIGLVRFDTFSLHTFGKVSKQQPRPPLPGDQFEIGPLSQIFTSLSLMVSQEKEHLLAHAPISEYLPSDFRDLEFQAVICTEINMPVLQEGQVKEKRIVSCRPDPIASGSCMTFCDLAMHTSGLPLSMEGGFDWNPFVKLDRWEPEAEPVPRDSFFQKLGRVTLNFSPGQSFKYSNTGNALLGRLLVEIREKPYIDLVREEVLLPLGLSNTGYFPERLLPGYNYRGKKVPPSRFDAAFPALGLHSNAPDLSRLLLHFIDPPDPTWEKMIEVARQDRIEVDFPTAPPGTLAGYGWFSSPLEEEHPRRVIWQYGGTAGFRAFVGVVLSTRTGVVILTNQTRDLKDLGFELLRELQPRARP